MPKMRRVIESLRTGKCSLGGPSKCVTNLLELGGGHHLTCCTAVVGDDWTRVVGCLRQNGFGLTLSSQKSECKCSSCDVLILLNSLSYACQACARAHINSPFAPRGSHKREYSPGCGGAAARCQAGPSTVFRLLRSAIPVTSVVSNCLLKCLVLCRHNRKLVRQWLCNERQESREDMKTSNYPAQTCCWKFARSIRSRSCFVSSFFASCCRSLSMWCG